MKLNDYIDKKHDGNQSRFARWYGVSHSQVSRWLKRGCLIENGDVYPKYQSKLKGVKKCL